MNDLTLADWLRERRRALALTQQQLAAQLGCSAETVRKIEAGQRKPSPRLTARLAAVMEVAVHQIEELRSRTDGDGSPWALAVHHQAKSVVTNVHLAIPAPLTPLVGREAECEALSMLLRNDGIRLVTLIGSPGVGKTRLAQAVAAAVQDHFPQGVLTLGLASLQDGSQIMPALARALRLSEAPDRPMDEQVVEALRQRQMLLVLDNVEHLSGAAPELARLLQHASAVRVVATSRAALRIGGEQLWTVKPLAFPAPDTLRSLAELATIPAVQLFVRQAQAADHTFVLAETNAAAVADICATLEGVPLALELAAALTRLLSLEALRAHLSYRLDVLTTGNADAPARHQSLRAAIAWSYALLSATERRVFRRLGVFVGGWTLRAAVAVAGDTGAAEREQGGAEARMLATLLALRDHSVIIAEASTDEPRFTMLEALREYALEQLGVCGEEAAIRDRHAAHMTRRAQEAEQEFFGQNQAIWLDRLERDHPNIQSALHHLTGAGAARSERAVGSTSAQHTAGDPVRAANRALDLVLPMVHFWKLRGYTREGLAWARIALAHTPAAGVPRAVLVQAYAGELALLSDDVENAVAWSTEAAAAAEQAGDAAACAVALTTLAELARRSNDLPVARRTLTRALAHARTTEAPRQLFAVLHELAYVLVLCGEFAQAATYYREERALAERLGHTYGLFGTDHGMGWVYALQGDGDRAAELFEQALARARELGYVEGAAFALANLGLIAYWRQRYSEAEAYNRESYRLCQQRGYRTGKQIALRQLGWVHLRQKRLAEAAGALVEALQIALSIGRRGSVALAAIGLAAVSVACGEMEHAARLLGAGEALLAGGEGAMRRFEQSDLNRTRVAVQANLSGPAFEATVRSGARLGLEEVASEALEVAVLVQQRRLTPVPREQAAGLTPRELEVLRLVAEGLSNPRIAELLIISPRTVHAHLRSIFGKLGVTSRSAATRLAVERGLTSGVTTR